MMFKTIRDNAQRKNLCFGCNRTIEDDESDAFYKYVRLGLLRTHLIGKSGSLTTPGSLLSD